jgi:hypothetical protein
MMMLNKVLLAISVLVVLYVSMKMVRETFQNSVYDDRCENLGQVINEDERRIVCTGPKQGVEEKLEGFQLDQCPEEYKKKGLC